MLVQPGNIATLAFEYNQWNTGLFIDPNSVDKVEVIDPFGAIVATILVIVHDSLGHYHADWTCPLGSILSDDWIYRYYYHSTHGNPRTVSYYFSVATYFTATVPPTLGAITRNVATGSAVITGIGATDVCTCHAVHCITKVRHLLGTITGPGTMTLNFTPFMLNIPIWGLINIPQAASNLEFQNCATGGIYSAIVDYPMTTYLSLAAPVISNYVRHSDRAEFDLTGLVPNVHDSIILYSKWDGSLGNQTVVAGHNIITGLYYPLRWPLIFMMLQVDKYGEGFLSMTEYGDLLTVAPIIYPTGMSIAGQILANIKTTLENILIVNGFHFDIKQVCFAKEVNVIKFVGYPAADMMYLGQDLDDDFMEGEMVSRLQVSVGVYTDRSDPNTDLDELIADVEYALYIDHTRGGLAEDTKATRTARLFYDNSKSPSGMEEILITVLFKHKYGDPYSQ